MKPWWDIDNAAIVAARALLGRQPRADYTIIQLPPAGAGAPTDLVPIWRNGQTYGLTLGQFPTPNGYVGAASSMSQLGFYSVKDLNVFGTSTYQATGNGTTDDTAALQGILANVPANAVVYFPPGTYKTTSTLNLVVPCYLVGQGRNSVYINSSAGGYAFSANGVHGFGFTGMRITNTAGGCLSAIGTNGIVAGVCQTYAACGDGTFRDLFFICAGYDAVLLNNFNGGYFSNCSFTIGAGGHGIHFTGSGVATATGKPQNGINLGYTLEVHVTDCVFGGAGVASDTTSSALFFDGYSDGQYIENCDLFSFGHAIAMAPNTRTATHSDAGVANSYVFNGFTGDVYISNCTPNSANSHVVLLQPQDATSAINSISFSNSQIAGADVNASCDGVLLDAFTNGGIVNGILFSNVGIGQNSQNGIQIRGCANVTYEGGYITGNQRFNTGGAYQIVLDGSACSNILFSGVNCSMPFNQTFITPYPMGGLFVGPYAHTNLLFRDCNFTGTTGALSNNLPVLQKETGQLQVRNCAGINPLGWGNAPVGFSGSGTVGYNLAPSDATVYISGGTVSAININNVVTGLTSGAFFMPAGSFMIITYTALPSVVGFAA